MSMSAAHIFGALPLDQLDLPKPSPPLGAAESANGSGSEHDAIQASPTGTIDGPQSLQSLARQADAASAAPADMSIAGGPMALVNGALTKLDRYQQTGTIRINGDTVTQNLGHGKTATYSLDQLAAHAKDPAYFKNTLSYAAKHGDAVKIDVHNDVASATDPNLEKKLPSDIPLREPILHASVKYDIDPKLLAAVGVQETHLGHDYLGSSSPDYNLKTHRGDVEDDSAGGTVTDRFSSTIARMIRPSANEPLTTRITPPIRPRK